MHGLARCCTGLLLPGERKSVEPMAARLAPEYVWRITSRCTTWWPTLPGTNQDNIPQVTIKPSEDARLPTLEARIERDWKQWRPSYYRMLEKEGTLQMEIKQTAL